MGYKVTYRGQECQEGHTEATRCMGRHKEPM